MSSILAHRLPHALFYMSKISCVNRNCGHTGLENYMQRMLEDQCILSSIPMGKPCAEELVNRYQLLVEELQWQLAAAQHEAAALQQQVRPPWPGSGGASVWEEA